jgi:methyl-accepting chemotaxis protein
MARSSKQGGWFARRTTIIDRKYQFLFAFQVFVVHTIVVLSIVFIVQNRIGDHVLGHRTAEIIGLEAVELDLLSHILRVGVVTGVFVISLAFWFSHRIVGPLPRLRKALQSAGRGDFTVRLKFRPGDALEPLADDFNAAMISLQRTYGAKTAKGATTGETREAADPSIPSGDAFADTVPRSA